MQDSIRGGVAQPSYLLFNHYYEFTEFISIVTEQHRVADCPPVTHVPPVPSVPSFCFPEVPKRTVKCGDFLLSKFPDIKSICPISPG